VRIVKVHTLLNYTVVLYAILLFITALNNHYTLIQFGRNSYRNHRVIRVYHQLYSAPAFGNAYNYIRPTTMAAAEVFNHILGQLINSRGVWVSLSIMGLIYESAVDSGTTPYIYILYNNIICILLYFVYVYIYKYRRVLNNSVSPI